MPQGYRKDGSKLGFQKGHKSFISANMGRKKGCITWNKGKHFTHSGSFLKGEKHSMWKGGINKYSEGYVFIYKPKHPNANKYGYIAEHRFVMEIMIGRYLTSKEIVHHKNGIRNDNRPENLILTVLNKHWHPCLCPKCGFEFLIK